MAPPHTVGFVITTRNQCQVLPAAIDSVLAQSHPDVEAIVVDDGSTDSTPAVLDQYRQRPRVRIVQQPHTGLPAARNRGLAVCTADLVCFLAGDDRLEPDYATRLAAALADDPSAGFAYCDVQGIDAADQPASVPAVSWARRVRAGDIFDSLVVGAYFPPQCVLIRRGLLVALGGFDAALDGHADYELWLRVTAEGHRAAFVDARLAFERVGPASNGSDLEPAAPTRALALERIAARYPARLASAVSNLQTMAGDLQTANAYLSGVWTDRVARMEGKPPDHAWSLLDHLAETRLADGTPDRLAVWDAIIDDQQSKSVFLHPPAILEATIPTSAPGRLTGAVTIHPDAWSKSEAAPCQFLVRMDGRITASIVLDPRARAADRRWVEIAVDVPKSAGSTHALAIETRAVSVPWFCWALFKDVSFGWRD